MARLTCSKSGVRYLCEHMPTTTEYIHPIFHLDQKRLLGLAGQWSAQKLTPTESYLLYLALLDSTSLVKWRTHAQYTPHTDAIVASNMEDLLHIIGKINLIHHPSFVLPSFAVSPETASLSNSHHWIQSWITNYNDWYASYQDSRALESLREQLSNREEALQRLIKSAIPPEQYADKLADWAAIAAEFPEGIVTHPITQTDISLSDYYKQIIRAAASEDKLWRYPQVDIEELIEHCEDNLQHGNIYAHTLMKYLRDGLRKYKDYLGFGDWDIAGQPTTYTIMPQSADVYDANVTALLATAPVSEPQKHQYPTHFAWLKAWTKWKISKNPTTSS